MFSKKYLNISAFAKLSGLSRQTLIYYDKIGLFSPELIGENKYRMYSHKQIDVINIITILSDLGVPLKKIKEFLADISPEKASAALSYQLKGINEKIKKLCVLRDMTELRIEQISEGSAKAVKKAVEKNEFCIKTLSERVPFFCGEVLNCLPDGISDDVITEFFNLAEAAGIPLIFAFGHVKEAERIVIGETSVITRLCFRLKNEKYANHFMPAGKYIIGYARGDYGKIDYIYDELLRFAKNNGLKLSGNVYEEYLIDELSEKQPNNFVVRVSAAAEPI